MTHLCIFKASNRFWGYEQYPQNHLDIYRKLNSEAKRIGSKERILIHRENNQLHYAYIRNLGYGQKIGIGLTDDRIFKDINSLFALFRTLSEELAKEELILKNRKASNQYKLSGESLTDRQTQIKLNIFINKISVYLGKQFAGAIKLPSASLAIAREDVVIDSIQRRDSNWFIERIKEGYHNIYISPQYELKPTTLFDSIKTIVSSVNYGKLLLYIGILLFVLLWIYWLKSCILSNSDNSIDSTIKPDSIQENIVIPSKTDNSPTIVNSPKKSEVINTITEKDSVRPLSQPEPIREDSIKKEIKPISQNRITPLSNGNLKVEVKGVSFIMVRVEHGAFMMGAPKSEKGSYERDRPVHKVTITNDYYIGETEVTQAVWTAIMGNNPSEYKEDLRRPVDRITWYDSADFIKELNKLTGASFRRPTEAEWEFAAIGGNKSKGYRYSGSNTLEDVGFGGDNDPMTTDRNGKRMHVPQPVKSLNPNELGIYDMSGNVDEWCEDYWYKYTSQSQTNPCNRTKTDKVVSRGGSRNCLYRDCRARARWIGTDPEYKGSNQGLRLALTYYCNNN